MTSKDMDSRTPCGFVYLIWISVSFRMITDALKQHQKYFSSCKGRKQSCLFLERI